MKVLKKYEAFFGKKFIYLLLTFTALLALDLLPFFRSAANANINYIGQMFYLWQFYSLGRIIYSYFKNKQDNSDECYSNCKAGFAVTMIAMFVFTVLGFTVCFLMKTYADKVAVNFVDVVFELECCLLLFSVMPFLLLIPTFRYFAAVFYLIFILNGFKRFIFPEPSVVVLIILAVLIPVVLFVSTKMMLKSVKNRLYNANMQIKNLQESKYLYDRLDCSYRIYTGRKLDYLIRIYLIFDLVTFGLRIILAKTGSFSVVNTSFQTAVVVSCFGFFPLLKWELFSSFYVKSCYFLSIKNRLNVSKNYYFITYFGSFICIMLFILLSYVAGEICHSLPENFLSYLFADIVSLCILFSVIPFMLTSKSVVMVFIKNMAVSFAFVLLKILIVKLHWSLLISGFVAAIVVMIFSNRYWVKRITRLYQEV